MTGRDGWAWVVAEVRSHYPVAPDSALLIGGSLARGWANPLSDVDVYLIGDLPALPEQPTRLDGGLRPIDVHLVSEQQLGSLLDLVSWSTALSGRDLTDALSPDDWLLLERISHPIMLVNTARIRRLQQTLDDSAFQYLAVSEHFTYADSFAEDALGQLEIGDLHSSVISAQASALRAIDGLLCSHGCYSLNPKWRARAFVETAPPELSFAEYWNVQTMSGLGSEDLDSWAVATLTVSRRLMTDVELPGVA